MSVPLVKSQRATIASLITAAKQHLFKQFPAHEHRLKSLLQTRFEPHIEKSTPIEKETPFIPALPHEEVVSVIQKVQQLSILPGLNFDKETELYLEQQLEDVLGFGLSSAINSVRLPFIKGLVKGLPHIFNSPSSSLSNITSVKEAGIAARRPQFGWQINSHVNSDSEPQTLYWVALPLRELVSTTWPLSSVKEWAYKRKILLINPTDSLFAIAEVLDEYQDISSKYQLGASPSIIREGTFWSPLNMGKCMIFFISDSAATPKPGVYSLL